MEEFLGLSIGLVDYGTGNLASLEMALADLDASTSLVSSPGSLRMADAVILPGVGHLSCGHCLLLLGRETR